MLMGWFPDKQETIMKKTYHTIEQIIRILREAETSGQRNEEVCRQRNISPQTFYRQAAAYGHGR
jgi:AraC-like DNA-binding protein